MAEEQNTDYDRFEALISNWKEGVQLAVCSYLCIRNEGRQNLLFGRTVLAASRMSLQVPDVRFESERVKAGRISVEIKPSDIDDLLDMAKRGALRVLGEELALPIATGNVPSTFFSPVYHPSVLEGPRLPSLRINGGPISDLLGHSAYVRPIDWELKSSDQPYDNLDELLVACGLPSRLQMGESTTLEIAAHAPGRITENSKISRGEAFVECRVSHRLDHKKIKVGYKILRGDQFERGCISGDGFKWKKENDTDLGSSKIPVGESPLAQAFFSYDGVALHQWWLADPDKALNPRIAIHGIFDGSLEILKKMLFQPEQDKSSNFEWAVASLFHLLGFSANNYGRVKKLQDGPDIIVNTPAGHVAVVECTIGLPDQNDKLAKLIQRTNLISEKLAGANYGHLRIQPIIATILTRAEVVAQLDTAAKHKIAVICKEDIEDYLKKILVLPKPEQIFQDFNRLIPSGQSSAFE